MAVTQMADVVVPQEFTAYTVQNSVVSTAFSEAGVMVQNGVMSSQLSAGATSFTAPYWNDLPDVEANLSTDNPADIAVPLKLSSGKQTVRKSFLNQSWSSMSLASELAGSNPLEALRSRVTAYWDRSDPNPADCNVPWCHCRKRGSEQWRHGGGHHRAS